MSGRTSAGRLPYRSKGSIVGWIVGTPLVLLFLASVFANENYQWNVVLHYLTVSNVVAGVGMTLLLTVICMAIGVVLGVVLACMVRARSNLVKGIGQAYVWFFRGTPLLVQLIFWYNLAALYPHLGLFGVEIDVNGIITPFVAAVLGLALNEAAYMAEIVRGGLISVDPGQREAAESLGLSPWQVMRRVVLPQAMRAIIPPTGNQTIGMLKNTSLVSVLGASELLHSVQVIYSNNYQTIPLLIVASVWYLVLTSVLSVAQHYLERHYSKGFSPLRRKKLPQAPTGTVSIPVQEETAVSPSSVTGTREDRG